ncbi:MAG: IS30 family transposase [Lachnospiraceae bacterium]|nr:IS30 family transposase [Lachnospiraceae bacterium]
MSSLIPGNQKHLSLDNRVFIEKCLDQDMTMKEIAKPLCKDPSTISKEVKKHRTFHPHNDLAFRVSANRCIKKKDCSLKKVCPATKLCTGRCASCKKINCNKVCKDFVADTCSRLLRAPFVCNGCPSKNACRKDKYYYKATTANRDYRTILVESREGINTTEEDLKVLDEIVSPLIRQGQSPAMILMNHPDLGVSEKTIYNYIERGYMSVINLNLQRKVKYKLRKCHKTEINDKGIFEGRTYKDFQELLKCHPDIPVVEMDTVLGCEGSKKVFLTLYFRSCKCLLIFLMPDKTAVSVKAVFDRLEKKLGTFVFNSLFQVILTDRGSEFSDPDALETGIDNFIRTSIYFCDPMCAWQKPGVEKSHEYIRYILPKGSSFDNLSQWDVDRIMNHINSSARASLNGLPPIRLAQLLFDQETYNALKLREISPDDIILTPDLIK